jgi:hypothetical protein
MEPGHDVPHSMDPSGFGVTLGAYAPCVTTPPDPVMNFGGDTSYVATPTRPGVDLGDDMPHPAASIGLSVVPDGTTPCSTAPSNVSVDPNRNAHRSTTQPAPGLLVPQE